MLSTKMPYDYPYYILKKYSVMFLGMKFTELQITHYPRFK